jgi:hypothetical protein
MAITILPAPPQRSDPINFATRADAFLTAIPIFAVEANTLATDVNSKQVAASTSASSASSSATAASTSASAASASQIAAAASETAAAASSSSVAWVSGATYAVGNVRYSPINFLSYRRKLAGSGVTDPSNDPTNWAPLTAGDGTSTGTGSVVLNNSPTLISPTLGTAVATGLSFSPTSSLTVPVGDTSQRPSGVNGQIRYNTLLKAYEGYNTSAWTSLGGGATGGGSDAVFVQNSKAITTSYTIPADKNASSVGPITVPSGVIVTVSSGSRWVIL